MKAPQLMKIEINSQQTTGHGDNIIVGRFKDTEGEFDLTFYRNPKNSKLWGTEYYSGKNYIVGSNDRSFSRNWARWKDLPKLFTPLAKRLKDIHEEVFKK